MASKHGIKVARLVQCPFSKEYHVLTRWHELPGGHGVKVHSEATRYNVTADVRGVKHAVINGVMDALMKGTDETDTSTREWLERCRVDFLTQANGV